MQDAIQVLGFTFYLLTLVPDARSKERHRKRWIENTKEDPHQTGSSVQQAAGQRWKVLEEICACSPIVGNLRRYTDGSKKNNLVQVERC